MTSAIQLFSDERDRQIVKKGFKPATDQQYKKGELLRAAICYAQVAHIAESGGNIEAAREAVYAGGFVDWPWDSSWLKTPDTRTCLVKAGALLAAHVDAQLPAHFSTGRTYTSVDDLVATLSPEVRERYRALVRAERQKLAEESRQLCYKIEALPCSEQQTEISVMAAALSKQLESLANE